MRHQWNRWNQWIQMVDIIALILRIKGTSRSHGVALGWHNLSVEDLCIQIPMSFTS